MVEPKYMDSNRRTKLVGDKIYYRVGNPEWSYMVYTNQIEILNRDINENKKRKN